MFRTDSIGTFATYIIQNEQRYKYINLAGYTGPCSTLNLVCTLYALLVIIYIMILVGSLTPFADCSILYHVVSPAMLPRFTHVGSTHVHLRANCMNTFDY